jgi:hypothetical protein
MEAFLSLVTSPKIFKIRSSFSREQLECLLPTVCRAYVAGQTAEAAFALYEESVPALENIIVRCESSAVDVSESRSSAINKVELKSNINSSVRQQDTLQGSGWQAVAILYLVEELTLSLRTQHEDINASICKLLVSLIASCIVGAKGQQFASENPEFLPHFVACVFRLDQSQAQHVWSGSNGVSSGSLAAPLHGHSFQCLESIIGLCQQEFSRDRLVKTDAMWPCHLLNLVCLCVGGADQSDFGVRGFMVWLEKRTWEIVFEHLNEANLVATASATDDSSGKLAAFVPALKLIQLVAVPHFLSSAPNGLPNENDNDSLPVAAATTQVFQLLVCLMHQTVLRRRKGEFVTEDEGVRTMLARDIMSCMCSFLSLAQDHMGADNTSLFFADASVLEKLWMIARDGVNHDADALQKKQSVHILQHLLAHSSGQEPKTGNPSVQLWAWWVEAYETVLQEQSLHLIEQVWPRIEAILIWLVHNRSLPSANDAVKLGEFSFDWMSPVLEGLFSNENTAVKKFALGRFFQFFILLHNGHVAFAHCKTLPAVSKVQEKLARLITAKTSPLFEGFSSGSMQSVAVVSGILPVSFICGTILTWTEDQSLYRDLGEGSKGGGKTVGEWLLLFLECHANGLVQQDVAREFYRAYIGAIESRESMSPGSMLCHMQLLSRKGVVPVDAFRSQELSVLRQMCVNKMTQIAGVGNKGLSEFSCRLYSALAGALVRFCVPESVTFKELCTLVTLLPAEFTTASRFIRNGLTKSAEVECATKVLLPAASIDAGQAGSRTVMVSESYYYRTHFFPPPP